MKITAKALVFVTSAPTLQSTLKEMNKMTRKITIVTHGDFDGAATAALTIARLKAVGIANENEIDVIFTQPFLVDKVVIPENTTHVFVNDLAVNNRNPQMTKNFITSLGDKLISWIDHHEGWNMIKTDNRFNIATSAPACAVIAADGSLIVSGTPRLQELVMDAITADTRKGTLSPNGQLVEDAMKADLGNDDTRLAVVKFMLGDESQRIILETAAKAYAAVLAETHRLCGFYEVDGDIAIKYTREDSENRADSNYAGIDYIGTCAIVDTRNSAPHDRTKLLLIGEELATFAIVIGVSPHGGTENITIATKSDVNLVKLFNLPSGAPFRVTLPFDRLEEVAEKLENGEE